MEQNKIEFSGKLPDGISIFLAKEQIKLLAIFIGSILFGMITGTILSFVFWDNLEGWIFLGLTIATFICAVSMFRVRITKKNEAIPNEEKEYSLTIADGKVTQKFDGVDGGEISITRVKKVIDYGKWYVIVFNTIGTGFPCPKDLLVDGTLEQFEKMFAGKIVQVKNK